MRVVVIGGTGMIGSKVVADLQARGHEAVAAAPATGVNTLTGEGLAEVLQGADVVLDVTNAPAWGDQEVHDFFVTSTRNQLAAEEAAGVGHHVALSIVGADREPGSGYLRAKVAQEELIRSSGRPYTIVRSTQFFEFVRAIADAATDGDTVRLTDALFQPIAADDVARFVTDSVLAPAADAVLEIGGPEPVALDELARRALAHDGDHRTVVGDPQAQYFGATVQDGSLTPGPGARLSAIRFDDWLAGDLASR
jgi:uncharacterized protein YbjT (DUF2867 family)